MIDYLKTFERSANIFPGFEAEIQGFTGKRTTMAWSVSTLMS